LTVVQTLELKIQPLALVLLAALFMWLGAAFVPQITFYFPYQRIAASAFIIAGVIVSTLGIVEFRRAETTVNPTKPESSSSLVTSGIYTRTRNPMYLGFLLILAGWGFWLGNLLASVVVQGFILYMKRFQIEPEERVLAGIFGEHFKLYCSQVRRWI
jgi:protein-S-isoprenylcysteine O-methyltransferase Ste14